MNILPRACAWVAILSFAVALVWLLLLLVDLAKCSKIPRPASYLSILALFAGSLLLSGAAVLIGEAAKRQSGGRPAVDGVMYFVFCATAGAILLLGTTIAAVGLFIRRKLKRHP